MNVVIRSPTDADAPVIAEFNQRLAWETERKQLDPSTALKGVYAQLSDPQKGWYLLACENGKVIGQLAVTFEWSDWRCSWIWWIQSVYVSAEVRKHGVFRKLYQAVIDRAREAGNVMMIRLYVEKANEKGLSTYRALGMTKTTYEVFEQLIGTDQE